MINKKKYNSPYSGLCCFIEPQSQIKTRKKDTSTKILLDNRERRKTLGSSDSNFKWRPWNGPQRVANLTVRVWNWGTNGDHPDYRKEFP